MVNDIYLKDKNIFRVIYCDKDNWLVIDCRKRNMPKWVNSGFLNDYEIIDQDRLLNELNIKFLNEENMSKFQIKEMRNRYSSISGPLLRIADEEKNESIYQAAYEYKVSTQTIRKRLCDYLAIKDIKILMPKEHAKRDLTEDEKNFRWALNKYFYQSKKLSLKQVYKKLIKEKYMNFKGNILQNCPQFHKFRYFYYKNRSESNFIISRLGRGEYDRNFRPLLGEGIREFCPAVGYGLLDSTTCDIFLVDDSGKLIGRPILTACVDGYSSICMGYSLGFEGGTNSLRSLMNNVIEDKVKWCHKFGIEINKEDWDCDKLPHKLITDRGREYIGEAFSQLVDLGVELINLDSFRPDLKSLVERFFETIQSYFKKELINKGVVLKDFGDRGAVDYRKLACLTLEQFEKILLLCVIHYNCCRLIYLPRGVDCKPYANVLWNKDSIEHKDNLIKVNKEILRLALLPRTEGRFKRNGLIVNKLRYKAFGFTNDYLKKDRCVVAFDPSDVSNVWLIRDGQYYKFELIEKYFEGKSLEECDLKNDNLKEFELKELEDEIRLSKDIGIVSNGIK